MSSSSHTFNRFTCQAGKHGVLVSIDPSSLRVTVDLDSGVTLGTLIGRLAGRCLTLTQTPHFDAVGIVGVISMSPHGSGLHGLGSALHDYVVAMWVVVAAPLKEGYAKVKLCGSRTCFVEILEPEMDDPFSGFESFTRTPQPDSNRSTAASLVDPGDGNIEIYVNYRVNWKGG
ncbi:L-gulonolactone oxidase 5 [Nymphaea thermarum]|nr:L-gulonolactone oxidase 5 [Nymphaea thermarum]